MFRTHAQRSGHCRPILSVPDLYLYLTYLINNFNIEVIRPPFIPERVAYIYPGEDEKDIKLTDGSVPKKEKEVTENLDGTLLVLKRKF